MKLSSVILTLFLSCQLNAQVTGYFGKRNFLEVEGLANFRVFSLLFGEPTYYKANGSSLLRTNNLLDYGLRASLTRLFAQSAGFSLEIGYDFQNISLENYSILSVKMPGDWNQSVNFKHEMLSLRTISIIPKIVFTGSGGHLPTGFTHEIGFGYTMSRIADKDYNYQITAGSEYFSDSARVVLENKYVDHDEIYSGFTLLYAIKMRVPVGKRILINYGLKYTVNIRNILSFHPINDPDVIVADYTVDEIIGRTRLYNAIAFSLGMTYAF